jgi:hypothetical protein
MKQSKSGVNMRVVAKTIALPALASVLLTACLDGRNAGPEEAGVPASDSRSLNNTDRMKSNYDPSIKVRKTSTRAQPGDPKTEERPVEPPMPSALAKSADINSRDVGVIMASPSAWDNCPAANRVIIYTDDEDVGLDNNQSLVWTWIQYDGVNVYDAVRNSHFGYGWAPWGLRDGTNFDAQNNTEMRICKVPGNTLRALKGDGREDFVVLRLDTECPQSAYKVNYYMDNEDTQNRNSNSGNIWPSSQSNGSGWTDFALCYFPSNATGAASLPALPYVGTEYAVFTTPKSGYTALPGALRFDEEDSGNNSYTHDDNFPGYPTWSEYMDRLDAIIDQDYSNSRSTWYFGRKTYP